MRIERCLIDANWGISTDVVYQFCRQSAHAAVLLPSHGRFVGASSVPFSEYKRKLGDRVGHNWRIPNVQGKRAVRHVVFDTNYWKSFLHARLAVAMGDRGCSVALWRHARSPSALRRTPHGRVSRARRKAAVGRSTNGSCGRRPARTTGSTVWSAAPWPHRCRALTLPGHVNDRRLRQAPKRTRLKLLRHCNEDAADRRIRCSKESISVHVRLIFGYERVD